MPITYSFTDNVSYGTEDINSIARDLTGAGIAPFPTQDTYSTSDLNAVTEALVASGVSLGGCLCSKRNNVVSVAQGIIFFENGVRMSVDADGYDIVVPENTQGFIYAYFNALLQIGDIEFAQELPSRDYCVVLAKISSDGTIADKRNYARSKVATFGTNMILEREFTILETPIPEEEEGIYQMLAVTRKLEDVDLSKFNYAIISFDEKIYGSKNRGIFDLASGKFLVSYTLSNADSTGRAIESAVSGTNVLMSNGIYAFDVLMRDGALLARQRHNKYTQDGYKNYPITVKLV